MTGDILARRYASALIELSVEDKIQDKVGGQLAAFSDAFETSDLKKALLDPALSIDEKKELLDKVAAKIKSEKILKNFMMLLLENKRISALSAINDTFQELLDEKMGRVKAEVILPEKAGKHDIDKIKKGLEKATGKEVVVDVKVDPSIIGGIVTRVGSIVYDGSIRTQLENIKNSIVRG